MNRWLSPFERRQRWARIERWTLVLAAVYVVLWLLDPSVYRAFPDPNAPVAEGQAARVLRHGAWSAFFRTLGELPFWLLLSLCLVLVRRRQEPEGVARGGVVALFLSPILAGIAAEALKIFVGRERPGDHNGSHEYREFFREDFFSSSGLAMPSSHAAVAFGGAGVLVALFPATWPVVLPAAALCAWGRVYAGAHFMTDVFVGALIGYGVARLLRPRPAR